MEQVSINAEARETGKGQTHRLRAEGLVPVVLYGKGVEPLHLSIDAKEMKRVLYTGAGKNNLLKVSIKGGKKADERNAVIKDLQIDPIKGSVLHADLYQISLTDKLTTTVPLLLVGEDQATSTGAVIQHQLREVEVSCLPTEIPEHLRVDVSGLQVGEHVAVSDIQIPDGVDLVTDPSEVVVTLLMPRRAEAEEEETEEAEAAPDGAQPEVVKKGKEEEPED